VSGLLPREPGQIMREELILASKSAGRAQILRHAGLKAEMCGADIDERALEAEFTRQWAEQPANSAAALPPALAQALAEAKAQEVSRRFPQALIIGCDQILELEGAVLHKVANEEEACQRLMLLAGRTHSLHSAFALASGGAVLRRYVETAHMTMRNVSPDYIRSYLKRADKSVLKSVGVYQVEGPGIRLFEAVKGDYWAIIGLPLLPLLRELRSLGSLADPI